MNKDVLQGVVDRNSHARLLFDTAKARLEKLCTGFELPVCVRLVADCDTPKVYAKEEQGLYCITLNAEKLDASEYEVYAAYHVRKWLLPQLVLETNRLLLRRYRAEDAEKCFGFLSNEKDAHMDCCRVFSTMDEAYRERVALFEQRETQYMVTLKDTGEVVGTVNLFVDDSRAVDAMEIGYSIAHEHQRKGYAYEALSALLSLLQKDLCLELVTAGILPENIASEGLLRKLAFRREGLRHKAVWHEGLDRPVDLIYFYRDRSEIN